MSASIDKLIEIHDDEIDAVAIANRIQAAIARHRAQAQADDRNFDAIARGLPPLPSGRVVNAATYYELLKTELSQELIAVSPEYRPVSIPILGRLWHRIRRQAHGLVLFYVNKATARQRVFNSHLLQAVRELANDLEAYAQSTGGADRSGLEDVRERLARLEQRLSGPS